jgi:hypothetical protein
VNNIGVFLQLHANTTGPAKRNNAHESARVMLHRNHCFYSLLLRYADINKFDAQK